MGRWRCTRKGCAAVVKKRPTHTDNERQPSYSAALLARQRELISNEGHITVCREHRLEIDQLLRDSAPQAPVPAENLPPSSPSSVSSPPPESNSAVLPPGSPAAASSTWPSSALSPSAAQSQWTSLFTLANATQLFLPTPAVILRSASLPAPLHLPSTSAPPQASARPLGYTDLRKPKHPYTKIVQRRHEPRFPRSLTGNMLEATAGEAEPSTVDEPHVQRKRRRAFSGSGRTCWTKEAPHTPHGLCQVCRPFSKRRRAAAGMERKVCGADDGAVKATCVLWVWNPSFMITFNYCNSFSAKTRHAVER